VRVHKIYTSIIGDYLCILGESILTVITDRPDEPLLNITSLKLKVVLAIVKGR